MNYDEFFEATKNFYQEFKIWKQATTLTHILVNGRRMKIQVVDYLDWIEWRIETENAIAMTEIEVKYSEYETLN